MNKRQIERQLERLIEPLRVQDDRKFRIARASTRDTGGIASKEEASEYLQRGVELLNELQQKLYAQDQWAVLVIVQGMDAAGKDGVIKHVMTGINPQGCQVYSFKAPSTEELDHDFLWRTTRALPEQGRIGIFNRSYYEEVLVVRVHPEILAAQMLPPKLVTKSLWRERFESINDFERHLTRNGTLVLKFFLHVSKREQKQRFLERLDEPENRWKFSARDLEERARWNDYMAAYEDMIRHTSTGHAPWYVIPADHKWFARLAVAGVILSRMRELGLAYPTIESDAERDLQRVRRALLAEGKSSGRGAKPHGRT